MKELKIVVRDPEVVVLSITHDLGVPPEWH